mgnify:CR=1 FL=1
MLLNNFNILVVDDAPLICNFLYSVAYKIPGFNAYKAFDYKAAIDILETQEINLLITDIELKKESGLELLSRIRSGSFTLTAHDIPIIVLSVNSYKELIHQCVKFDVNDFLVKPISSVKLTEKIHEHKRAERTIKPAEYYLEKIKGATDNHQSFKEYSHRGVAIVLGSNKKDIEPEVDKQQPDISVKNRDFLEWPDSATTGHHQIDRRLKKVAYTISYFYNSIIENRKYVAIENARSRVCESADYLIYIGKNIKQYDHRPDFLKAFQICLDRLEILIAQIASANLKNRNQVLALLRKLSAWWAQTCNRPLIQA